MGDTPLYTGSRTPDDARPIGGYLFPLFPRLWWTRDAPLVRALCASLDTALETVRQEINTVKSMHWLDEAAGRDLNDLGAIVATRRLDGEGDGSYRRRIPALAQSGHSGATHDGMVSALEDAFSVPADATDGPPGQATVYLLATPLNPQAVRPFVQRIKGLGIQIDIFIQGGGGGTPPDEPYPLRPADVGGGLAGTYLASEIAAGGTGYLIALE